MKKHLIKKIILEFNEKIKKMKKNKKIKLAIKEKIILENDFRTEIRSIFNKKNYEIKFTAVIFDPNNNFEVYIVPEVKEEKFDTINKTHLIDNYDPNDYSCESVDFDYDYSSSEEDNELLMRKKPPQKAFVIFMEINLNNKLNNKLNSYRKS